MALPRNVYDEADIISLATTNMTTQIESKWSPDTTSGILLTEDTQGTPLLHRLLFKHCDSEECVNNLLKMIAIAPQPTIDEALCIQDKTGNTIFHHLKSAPIPSPKIEMVLKALISKVSTPGVDRVLTLTSSHRKGNPLTEIMFGKQAPPNVLDCMVESCPSEILEKVLLKASAQGINKALLAKKSQGLTPLHTAVIGRAGMLPNSISIENFETLISKALPYVIYTAILDTPARYRVAFTDAIKTSLNVLRVTCGCDVLLAGPSKQFINDGLRNLLGQFDIVFDRANLDGIITIEDCKKWLAFFNQELQLISDEHTLSKSEIEMACVKLNLIAAEYINDDNEKIAFKKAALKHANNINIPLPGGMVMDSLVLAYLYDDADLFDEPNTRQLYFLRQGISVDEAKSSNSNDQVMLGKLSKAISSSLGEGSSFETTDVYIPEDNEQKEFKWGEIDEYKYKKAIYYLEAKEYLEMIRSQKDILASNTRLKPLHDTLEAALATAQSSINPQATLADITTALTTFKAACLPRAEEFKERYLDTYWKSFLENLCNLIAKIPVLGMCMTTSLTFIGRSVAQTTTTEDKAIKSVYEHVEATHSFKYQS